MGKSPKDRRGTAQDERFALIFALPPVPHYEGRSTGKSSRISGAQNLSGFYRFIPGHWALALQKLMLVRFHLCAWLCRANAAGANLGGRPKGLPYTDLEGFLNPRRGGACPSRRPLARSVIPCRGGHMGPPASHASTTSVGSDDPARRSTHGRAVVRAAPMEERGQRLRIRRSPELHLSPATQKGALPTGRSTTQRLPATQRQR